MGDGEGANDTDSKEPPEHEWLEMESIRASEEAEQSSTSIYLGVHPDEE